MKKKNQTPGRAGLSDFFKVGEFVVAKAHVVSLDFSQIQDLKVQVHTSCGQVLLAEDIDAIELALATKPSILEGKRLRWPRLVWAIHNLFAHPVMQLLAFAKLYKWAFWLHDVTVPKPLGRKASKT